MLFPHKHLHSVLVIPAFLLCFLGTHKNVIAPVAESLWYRQLALGAIHPKHFLHLSSVLRKCVRNAVLAEVVSTYLAQLLYFPLMKVASMDPTGYAFVL